jgi:hypothetical protein
MKSFLKVVLVIVLFAMCYAGVMVFAYDYLYPYPVGVLDDTEREAKALNYKLVVVEDIDSDTTLYFTRSKNGVGNRLHVGTIDSDKPDLLANFFCTETSSVYLPIDAYGYTKATDTDQTCYLYGGTSDENTVSVIIRFYTSPGDYSVYEEMTLPVEEQTFHLVGFDENLAQYSSRIFGINDTDGITFEYAGDPLTVGGYVAKPE